MTASTHKTSWSGQYQRPIEHSSTSGRNARCLQLFAGAVVRPARQIEHFGGTRSSLFSSMQSFRIPKKCSPWATEVRAIRGSPSVGRPSPKVPNASRRTRKWACRAWRASIPCLWESARPGRPDRVRTYMVSMPVVGVKHNRVQGRLRRRWCVVSHPQRFRYGG